jgi:uncharacterized protein YicC (UPF0701 family)
MSKRPKTLAELEKVVQQTSKRVLDLGNWMLDLLGLVQRVSGVMALLQTKQVAMAEEVQQHLKMPHAVPQEGLVETRARCDELRNEVAALSSRLTELESARAGEDARAIADLSERVAAIQERLATPGPEKSEPAKDDQEREEKRANEMKRQIDEARECADVLADALSRVMTCDTLQGPLFRCARRAMENYTRLSKYRPTG